MDISTYLENLPAGGQTKLAREVGVSPAYLYQMVKGIRPIAAERVISLSKATGWAVTPNSLRPDIYPNPTDGLPADRIADLVADGAIKPNEADRHTRFSGGGGLYSAREQELRREERRQRERRQRERRKGDRRQDD